MIPTKFAPPVKQNSVLNPKVWDHDHLKGEVKGALLRIAEDFIKFVDLPFEVVDIVITGGNANYNYTEHSDIDLHIITDYNSIECDRTAAELFDTKRLLYKRDYDVNIRDIPVELYVEDMERPAVSGGSYSIMNDQWLSKPNPDIPDYDEAEVKRMVKVWHEIFRHAVYTGDLQTCRKSVQLLRKYRQMGLDTAEAEFSTANLVYKSLRNDASLKGITTFIDRLHDQELSLGQ